MAEFVELTYRGGPFDGTVSVPNTDRALAHNEFAGNNAILLSAMYSEQQEKVVGKRFQAMALPPVTPEGKLKEDVAFHFYEVTKAQDLGETLSFEARYLGTELPAKADR